MRRQVLKIAIGVALLALVLWKASAGDVTAILARADAVLLLAILAVCVQIGLAALRWGLLIGATGATLGPAMALRTSFVASLLGQVMPGGIGVELARVWMGRITGIGTPALVALALLDRVFLLVGLALVAAGGLLFAGNQSDRNLVVIGGCIAVSALLTALALSRTAFVRRMVAKATSAARSLQRVLHAGKAKPALIVGAASLAVLAPVNLAVAAWLIARSLGIDLDWPVALTWVPIVLAASAIPVSVGGWGVREAAAVAILGRVGMPAAEALALSIGLGLTALVASLPGALMLPDWRVQTPDQAAQSLLP